MNDRTATDYIAIHCSATHPGKDIGRAEIKKMHTDKGWSDIGYNIVIRRDGRVEIGRNLRAQGAHVRGFNGRSLGVCLVGGVSRSGAAENNFTQDQFNSLTDTLLWLDRVWPGTIIQGHRDFSPDLNNDGVITSDEWLKECPCFDVKEFCRQEGVR